MKKIYICVCPRVIKCNCKLAHQVLNNIGVKNLAMIIKTVYCWCCFIDIKDCKKILITILCLKKNKELRVSKVSVYQFTIFYFYKIKPSPSSFHSFIKRPKNEYNSYHI